MICVLRLVSVCNLRELLHGMPKKLLKIAVVFHVHTEDHNGYCSGADVQVDDDDTTEFVYLKVSDVKYDEDGDIDLSCLSHLNTYKEGCGHGSGYCGTGASYKEVTSARAVRVVDGSDSDSESDAGSDDDKKDDDDD